MSNKPASLTFVHRFRSGTLGTLTLSCDGDNHIAPAEYIWNGPIPRLDKERLELGEGVFFQVC